MDAFIAGLPVIASNWNMNMEIIKQGETGLIIPPKDVYSLSMAMKKLIDHPELLNNFSKNAFCRAKEFHIDNIMPGLKNIIEL